MPGAHSATQVTPYAASVPQPKKTGNVARDCQLSHQRLAFMELISTAERHPQLVYALYDFARELVIGDSEKEHIATIEKWRADYCPIEKLPQYCRCLNMEAFLSGNYRSIRP